jgi:hypothetical protein
MKAPVCCCIFFEDAACSSGQVLGPSQYIASPGHNIRTHSLKYQGPFKIDSKFGV